MRGRQSKLREDTEEERVTQPRGGTSKLQEKLRWEKKKKTRIDSWSLVSLCEVTLFGIAEVVCVGTSDPFVIS